MRQIEQVIYEKIVLNKIRNINIQQYLTNSNSEFAYWEG